jgi:hypothetical protein
MAVLLRNLLKIQSNQKFRRNLGSLSVPLLSIFKNNSAHVLDRTDIAAVKPQTETFEEFRT